MLGTKPMPYPKPIRKKRVKYKKKKPGYSALKWTDAEMKILADKVNDPSKELKTLIPNRTLKALQNAQSIYRKKHGIKPNTRNMRHIFP